MKTEINTRPPVSAESIAAEVVRIWKELLGVEDVAPGDNFLLMGGESLLATQASARLADAFGLEVPIRSILIGTVDEIVRAIVSSLDARTQ